MSAAGSRRQLLKSIGKAFAAMPDAFRDEFVVALTAFAPRLLAEERAGVPVRHGPRPALFAASRPGGMRPAGGLVSLLATKIDPAKLTLSAGLITPETQADGFYGYILDVGRGFKSSLSRPRRRLIAHPAKGKRGRPKKWSVKYSRRISPIPADRYDIAFGRVRQWALGEAGPMLVAIADRAVAAVAWGDA